MRERGGKKGSERERREGERKKREKRDERRGLESVSQHQLPPLTHRIVHQHHDSSECYSHKGGDLSRLQAKFGGHLHKQLMSR